MVFPTGRVRVAGVDDTWSADLVDMQSFLKCNDEIKYLLNVIDVVSKYTWSICIRDKTSKPIVEAIEAIQKERPRNLCVDRGGV